MNRIIFKKFISAFLLTSFIIFGLIDALLHQKTTYSSIMGMDIFRVYFYTFFLLIIGCWLLFHKFFVGIGFITLATFSNYFFEYVSLHNYFASIAVYGTLFLDLILQRKFYWLIPFICLGLFQGLAFQLQLPGYFVGAMEFFSLSLGAVFIVKHIK